MNGKGGGGGGGNIRERMRIRLHTRLGSVNKEKKGEASIMILCVQISGSFGTFAHTPKI